MGNIERRFEQERNFCNLQILNRYIFDENMLVIQAIEQCFPKEYCFKTSCFMLKFRGMINFMMSFFLSFEQLNQNENYENNLNVYLYQEKKNNSK